MAPGGAPAAPVTALTNSIIAAMAVLNAWPRCRRVHALRWSGAGLAARHRGLGILHGRRCSGAGRPVVDDHAATRGAGTGARPSMSRVFQGLTASSGPMNISYRRSVSAPYSAIMSSGLTTFFRLLDIFAIDSASASPVVLVARACRRAKSTSS